MRRETENGEGPHGPRCVVAHAAGIVAREQGRFERRSIEGSPDPVNRGEHRSVRASEQGSNVFVNFVLGRLAQQGVNLLLKIPALAAEHPPAPVVG